MKRILPILVLLLTVGAWAKPHQNIGPLGEWVSNGRWLMKVKSVEMADNSSEFAKLPWKKGIASPDGQKYKNRVERLAFSKSQRLAVLDIELKNIGKSNQKIGSDTPSWNVRCDDGQEIRNTGAVANGAQRFLVGHLPKLGPVAAGATLKGRLLFVLPKGREAKLLFFKASPSMEKFAGKSESLVSRLQSKTASGSGLTPSNPNAPWKTNKLWKMRLTDSRVVSDIAGYKSLPWGSRMKGADRDKHFSYVSRNVFNKGGKVLLVTLEVKNLSDRKLPIGYETPFWKLHSGSAKPLRVAGVHQKQIPWALNGGFPKNTLLNAKAKTSGTFGFFLPAGFSPEKLDFETVKSLEKSYGSSGSIRFSL